MSKTIIEDYESMLTIKDWVYSYKTGTETNDY